MTRINPGRWFPLRRRKRPTPSDDEAITHRPLLDHDEIRALFLRAARDGAARRDVTGQQAGEAPSSRRGQGLDYLDSRPYQTGDDIRFMDWRLSARAGEPRMKVFHEETRRGVLLLIDRRGPMRFGTRARLKLTQALRLAITVAAAHREQATLSTLLLDDRLRWSAPETTEHGLLNLLNAAAGPAPPLPPDTPQITPQVTLGQALDQLRERLEPGAILYLLSDFIDLTEQHRPALLALRALAAPRAILLHDPAERRLPAAGPLDFVVGDNRLAIDTSDPAIQAEYRRLAEAYFAARRRLLRDAGIPCRLLSTRDDDLDAHV